MGNTQDEIKTRMLAEISDEYDKTEGSFFYDAIMPAAIELARAYTLADDTLTAGFAQTTSGQYLDYRAAEHGLTRKEAARATGTITITGASGTTVSSGALIATAGGVQFQTTVAATIESTGTTDVAIAAVEAGTSGNKPAAAINSLPVSITGVTSVTNASATTGGTDEETDADLLERLLESVREPTTSGNSANYKQWAKEVTGVGDAKVYPLWNGAGTVKVLVIDSEKQPVTADIIEDVANHIEETRPIGAAVTVMSATGLSINVSAALILASSAVLADVQSSFESALESYLQDIAFDKTFVSYAHVGSMLLNIAGVTDYTNLLLNSGTINVTIGDTKVAVIGTVSLSE